MQHIAHVFIGSDFASFRDTFAATFRRRHPEIESPYFSALLLSESLDGTLSFAPDTQGDKDDACDIAPEDRENMLHFYFQGLYDRKVTVAHPGNRCMVVVLWTKLYDDGALRIPQELVNVIEGIEDRDFKIEVAGFTDDTVACFVEDPAQRQSPALYARQCADNIAALRELRHHLAAARLIYNHNTDSVALNLDADAMARVCAEHAALMCEQYTEMHRNVTDSEEHPFESFGLSSVIFDVEYYKDYIRNSIILNELKKQGIDSRSFTLNALSQSVNPVITQGIGAIRQIYTQDAQNAIANLKLQDANNANNVVTAIDEKIRAQIGNLKSNLEALLTDGQTSIFKREALMAFILGEDCDMFDISSVDAGEMNIEDVVDDSVKFFTSHDPDQTTLSRVSNKAIKKIRHSMRNIASANRLLRDQLKALNVQPADASSLPKHIEGGTYLFNGTRYKLNVTADDEQMEPVYEPHTVSATRVDLRCLFAPVRNQGSEGNSASYAIASVVEALRRDGKRYSPAALDSAAGGAQTLGALIIAAEQTGICAESDTPASTAADAEAQDAEGSSPVCECRVLEAQSLNPSLDDIKSALSDGYPVLVAMRVFDSFAETNCGFVRRPSHDDLSRLGGRIALQAMVVCGYSDNEKVLIMRGSWGNSFGDNGYCYVPYSYARRYILQACIIRQVTAAANTYPPSATKTIDFNLGDRNIQAAILQNQIEENEVEIEELSGDSTRLKALWFRNLSALTNVQTQSRIIEAAKEGLNKEIETEAATVRSLTEELPAKVNDFRKARWIIFACLCLVTLVVAGLWLNDPHTLTAIIVGALAVITACYFGVIKYQVARCRQELLDEIDRHSRRVDRLKAERDELDVKAHIHGLVIREVDNFRIAMAKRHQAQKGFNRAWEILYRETADRQRDMSPGIPYPFLNVLENSRLDSYYAQWADTMRRRFSMDSFLTAYMADQDLAAAVTADPNLHGSIVRGLRGFDMRAYLIRPDHSQWLFLPETTDIAQVMADMDQRAKPFCPYRGDGDGEVKYLFMRGVNDQDMMQIAPHFQRPPHPLHCSDPYSITLLHILRYNLD